MLQALPNGQVLSHFPQRVRHPVQFHFQCNEGEQIEHSQFPKYDNYSPNWGLKASRAWNPQTFGQCDPGNDHAKIYLRNDEMHDVFIFSEFPAYGSKECLPPGSSCNKQYWLAC